MIGTPYTLGEIARIVGAEEMHLSGSPESIREISFDSRKIYLPEGTLFLALKTPNSDGHLYLHKAAEKGVRNFLVSNSKDIPSGASYIRVEDTLEAIQKLAAHHRQRFSYPVIGLTGSNGKTIVKEWLSSLLDKEFRVIKSPKSYNSQLGVPISLLQMQEDHELALIEAGISRVGEMEKLEAMIRPDLGIMTRFGDAHDEGFSSKEEKLRDKLSLFADVKKVVVTADDPMVLAGLKKMGKEVVTVGLHEEAKLRVNAVTEHPEGWTFRLSEGKKQLELEIPVPGPAALENALLVIAAARTLGLGYPDIREGLSRLYPISMRMQIISDNPDVTILNDAYNADLASIRNAFLFLENSTSQPGKELILSDLEHQGSQKEKVQEAILKDAVEKFGAAHITLVGPEFHKLAPPEVEAYPTTEAFLANFDYTRFRRSVVLLKGARKYELEKIIPYLSMQVNATLFRVNLNSVIRNLRFFKEQVPPGTKMMVMVKAYSYGTGSWEIAQVLEQEGVDYLAVAYLSEGIHLRNRRIGVPIMVMNPDQNGLDQLFRFDLQPEVYSFHFLEKYLAAGLKIGAQKLPVHIKVDTGMHRLGFSQEDIPQLTRFLREHPEIEVVSVMSHLAAADDPAEDDYTREQIRQFTEFADALSEELQIRPMRHILNTAGILRFSEYSFDMVRLGLGLYGLSPIEGKTYPELKEIGSLVTVISQIREYPPGTSVGYGRSQHTDRPSRIATLPVGYADGIPRLLSNGKVSFLVRGKFAPVFGRVCMDMLMLDVTDIPEARPGDEVVLFGWQGGRFQSVKVLAEAAGTISYEILAGISHRVRRVYGMD